jgi:hypothetical protein
VHTRPILKTENPSRRDNSVYNNNDDNIMANRKKKTKIRQRLSPVYVYLRVRLQRNIYIYI